MKEAKLLEQAAKAIRTCLSDIPFILNMKIRTDVQMKFFVPDIVVDLKMKGNGSQRLVIEVKSSGQPRIARDAVNQLIRYRTSFPDTYGVFIATYISPQAAEICDGEGIGYIDLEGNCRLAFEQVFILREGIRNTRSVKRTQRSLNAPKSARILRVLLMTTTECWKTLPLAREAGVSIGQVANVRKLLGDREWISECESGFRLSNPQALLAEWAENYTFRKNRVRDFYTMLDTDVLEKVLSDACRELGIQYAFTGFSGARRIAPAVRGQRSMAYVGEIPDELIERLRLKEVTSGANVSLMLPYDDGVFLRRSED